MNNNFGLNIQLSNVKLEGHKGTWYPIDKQQKQQGLLILWESEQYGDEAACIITDTKYNIILEDVWNGFEDLDDLES